jgi:hypothetical protein
MPADREDLKKALVERLTQRWGFPLASAPYCDLAEELDSSELEVLDAVLELRSTGEVGRINAEFEGGPMGFCSEYDGEQMTLPPVAGIQFTCAEADLAMLAADNLPYGEHPYEELAAELNFRGVDANEAWVLDRLHAWMDAGVVVRFGAERVAEKG